MTKVITGQHTSGHKIGREIGFPTINLLPDEPIYKKDFGVYICYAYFSQKRYPSILNLGNKPTINDKEELIEIYILSNLPQTIPSKVKVELLKKVRDIKKFETLEDLKQQIKEDVNFAKQFFRL